MEGLDNRCEPVYRQRVAESNRSSHNFLSSLTGGFWIVGTVPDTRYGQILFHGEERCPESEGQIRTLYDKSCTVQGWV